jgi:hypothetical protein
MILAPEQIRGRIRDGDARERARFAALPDGRLDDIIAFIQVQQQVQQTDGGR